MAIVYTEKFQYNESLLACLPACYPNELFRGRKKFYSSHAKCIFNEQKFAIRNSLKTFFLSPQHGNEKFLWSM